MRRVELEVPQLGLIAATRAMLGAGIGLLVAPRLRREHRRAVGWTLLLVGLVTTIPLLALVFGRRSSTGASLATGAARGARRRLAEVTP